VEDRCLLSGYNTPIDLGTLAAPGLTSNAYAINNTTGQVVGVADSGLDDLSGNPIPHPFLWTPGGTDGVPTNPQMKDLGTLAGASNPAWARDLNGSGQVVGWSDSGQLDASGNPIEHAFLWTPGGADGVPSNPQMKDLQITRGLGAYIAINNSSVVVGSETTSAGLNHAFVWDPTHGVRDLNGLIPGNRGVELRYATAVNNEGQIVANGFNGSFMHAYLLTDTNGDGTYLGTNEFVDLGTLRKATTSSGYAINDAAKVAGTSGSDGFVWQNGAFTDLGQIRSQGNSYTPIPESINNGGTVVGYSGQLGRAWVWAGSGGVNDLNGLIPKNSGWFLTYAWGINDAGQIVGQGTSPSGVHAFLLTPTSSSAAAMTTSATSLTDPKTASSGLAPVDSLVLDDLAHWLSTEVKGRRLRRSSFVDGGADEWAYLVRPGPMDRADAREAIGASPRRWASPLP
jgi:probable HAF family extracellular repeat protein